MVNVLRIQFERQQGGLFPSVSEYSNFYMMTQDRIRMAKPDLLLLAPGPINRGVELTPEVADGKHSAILDQVTNGLAVRMAVLYLLSGKMEARAAPSGVSSGGQSRALGTRKSASWENLPCRPSRLRAGGSSTPARDGTRTAISGSAGATSCRPVRATKTRRS